MNIVLFDGVCNLCNTTVAFLIKHDKQDQLRFAAQQSDAGKNLLLKYKIDSNFKSVILIKEGEVFYKSDAVIEISKLITGWPKMFQHLSFVKPNYRNWAYNWIAENRYKVFGKKEFCALPNQEWIGKFIT